jgi:hypothetical protein
VIGRRVTPLLGAAVMLAGCVEFAEPVIPDRRAPAVLQANMRVFDAGLLQVDGSLSPGREETGFLRVVESPFIQVGPHTVEPRALGERGLRTYHETFAIPRGETAGPFEMIVPAVRGTGTLPPVRWWGLQRVGPDTLAIPHGADIVLRLDTVPEASVPATRFRQWFIDVRSGGASFRISADGTPPPVLRIPAEWVPAAAADGRVDVALVYLQSAQLRTPDNTYIASIVLDVRLNWVVLLTDPS